MKFCNPGVYLSFVLLTAGACGCSEGAEETAAEYAEICESALSASFDVHAFEGADSKGSLSYLLAHVYRIEVGSVTGAQERPRPDVRLIVSYSADSKGFECLLLTREGFSAAATATFGDGEPSIQYAVRTKEDSLNVVTGFNGEVPSVLLSLRANENTGTVERWYPTPEGDVQSPGLKIDFGADGETTICDHRSGRVEVLDADDEVIATQSYGCEQLDTEEQFPPNVPITIKYDGNGNRIEERWVSGEVGPGRTSYDVTTNERGDWVSRKIAMSVGKGAQAEPIRTEFRHLEYRQ